MPRFADGLRYGSAGLGFVLAMTRCYSLFALGVWRWRSRATVLLRSYGRHVLCAGLLAHSLDPSGAALPNHQIGFGIDYRSSIAFLFASLGAASALVGSSSLRSRFAWGLAR